MFSSFFIRLRKLENCVRNETIYIKKVFLVRTFSCDCSCAMIAKVSISSRCGSIASVKAMLSKFVWVFFELLFAMVSLSTVSKTYCISQSSCSWSDETMLSGSQSVSILSKACVLDSWFSAPFFIDVFGGSQTLLSVEVRIFSKAMSLLLTYITVFSSRLRMFVWNERSILLIFGYKDMHDGCIAETSLPISLITKWKFAVNSFSWKREACKLLIT